MPYRRLSVRKTKEISRLNHAGVSGRAIARVIGVSNSASVPNALSRLRAADLAWRDVEAMTETRLEHRLYREDGTVASDPREPDWAHVRTEVGRKHVTLQLLWAEYRREHPDGYAYSWYCERYRAWRKTTDPVMRQEHTFGEKLFVDWAGDTVPIVDGDTGEITCAHLFVAVLGGSSYTYVEAFANEGIEAFLTGHANALSYFGGAPALLVCDNLKTGVKCADRYEPELNRDYADLAAHYGCSVLPARVRKPRDKAKVEAGVLIAYRLILAPLRNRTFFSLSEFNAAVAGLLEILNTRPLKKLPGSRRSVFSEHEAPLLRPLPGHPYRYRRHTSAQVHIDYHVEVERHRYSVPYRLIGESVEVFIDRRTVEIYHKGERVALHLRSQETGRATTDAAHMPSTHREWAAWTPKRMESWAATTGPACAAFVARIMAGYPHPELGFRNCLGLISLGRKHGEARLEAACARALASGASRYRSVKSILDSGLDACPLEPPKAPSPICGHDNLRGPDYYA
jgi:transposase